MVFVSDMCVCVYIYIKVKIKVNVIVNLPPLCWSENRSLKVEVTECW